MKLNKKRFEDIKLRDRVRSEIEGMGTVVTLSIPSPVDPKDDCYLIGIDWDSGKKTLLPHEYLNNVEEYNVN